MKIAPGLLLSVLVGAAAAATPGTGNVTGPLRPPMSAAQAAEHTAAHYLADGPRPWAPDAVDAQALKPDFVVAADGRGTHRTVQAAVDAVPAATAGGVQRRWVIQIRPGTYREPLCVQGKAPLTLIGRPGDASAVRLVEGRYNAMPKPAGTAAHACWPDLPATTYGTYGSASVVFASDDLTAAHLTIANDAMDGVKAGQGYPPGAGESGGAQAVALMTIGDRVLLERVQLLAHQDTLHVRRAQPALPGRVLVRASLIAGDVDYIFGNATLVIDDSTILQRAGRRQPPNGGHVLAPSTPAAARLGFLVQRTRFTAEPGVAPGSISLARAWDENVARGTWRAGVSPNGQVLIRDSQLGPHLGGWSASTSRRPYSATGEQANRFFDFNNRALPADPAREVLPADGGWAAAEGGTRGGADAAPEDVHTVRNRAELEAALKPHLGADGRPGVQRPRLVKVAGRIDLAQAQAPDEGGRVLGFDDFRDPAFSWGAFEAAYAPATWGQRKPEGVLEEARRRSAKRQAAQVMVAVPSNTTIVGLGAGAEIVNGGLVLDGVQQVILRHLHLRRAYDHFPTWDPNDNASGEWNSAYDTLMLRNARHVWVDHCHFDDGEPETQPERVIFGRPLQRFDGLLDIIRGSQFVTVSHSHFRGHDKTMLIGNSDSLTSDDGKLQVTLHHNLWEDVKERAPRVRWGQVHLLNNLYLVNPGSEYSYSLGLGQGARVFSELNAWQTPIRVAPTQLVRVLKGSLFRDLGSLHNGRPLDLAAALRAAGASVSEALDWEPLHPPAADPAEAVAARVKAAAGPGWLWLGAP